MIDIHSEPLITLSEAARMLPKVNGRGIHPSSVYRWCRKGIRGRRLECCEVGRRIFTSGEALNRFLNHPAEADHPDDPISPRTPTKKERSDAIARAHKELECDDI